MGHGVRLVFRVGYGGELPVALQAQAVLVEHRPMGRGQLPQTPKHAAAGGASGSGQQKLQHGILVRLRLHPGVGEQTLELRGEDQRTVFHGVKQGLYAHAVPGEEAPPRLRLPQGEGKDAV